MLEVVLTEGEGTFIPNYNISEDSKCVVTESLSQGEISSLSIDNRTDIQALQKIEKKFQCCLCDHHFKHSSDVSRHVREVHLKYRPYQCGICGYRSCRIYNLRAHMKSIHNIIKTPHHHFKNCSTTALEAPQKLDQHQESQHIGVNSKIKSNSQECLMNVNEMDKIFFCSYCQHKTKWRGSLRNHIIAVHMKMKPYHCPICNYKSSTRFCIMRHFKAVHVKNKPHLCSLCPYRATRYDTLKVHMRRIHKEKMPSSGEYLTPKDLCLVKSKELDNTDQVVQT